MKTETNRHNLNKYTGLLIKISLLYLELDSKMKITKIWRENFEKCMIQARNRHRNLERPEIMTLLSTLTLTIIKQVPLGNNAQIVLCMITEIIFFFQQ